MIAIGMGERSTPTGVEHIAREDSAAAQREQWDDADNFLAIAPGVVLGYDRNLVTNRPATRSECATV